VAHWNIELKPTVRSPHHRRLWASGDQAGRALSCILYRAEDIYSPRAVYRVLAEIKKGRLEDTNARRVFWDAVIKEFAGLPIDLIDADTLMRMFRKLHRRVEYEKPKPVTWFSHLKSMGFPESPTGLRLVELPPVPQRTTSEILALHHGSREEGLRALLETIFVEG
jgi:hypothetical protein